MSLLAPAYAPDPSSISITIDENSVTRVEFSMKPRGSLSGYVVKTKQSNNQAGAFLEPDPEIQIQTITLRGGEITRTLIPVEEELSYPDHYLTETDYAAQGVFYFYGLPAGEYELTITANGYQQYSETHKVRPGQYENAIAIKLVE